MSNNSYYTSERNDRSLPPLREYLRDVYPAGNSGHGSRAHRSEHPAPSSRYNSASSAHGADEDANRYRSHSSRSNSNPSSYMQQSHPPAPTHSHSHSRRPVEVESPPSFEYGVYRTTPEQLVQERTSTRDEFPLKSARTPQDASKRHVCHECDERFDRPTSLETHMRTHTGERPFECSYRDCHKTFSVLSNMRRHERIHVAESAFEPAIPRGSTSDAHRNGASSNTRRSTSSYTPSPQYYSSTHRN